jgi:hypothetical protein
MTTKPPSVHCYQCGQDKLAYQHTDSSVRGFHEFAPQPPSESETKKRFVIRVASGLYRDKPTNRYPEGRPYHRPLYIVWDTKPGRGGKAKGMVCYEEDKEIAEHKCERLNAQEDL